MLAGSILLVCVAEVQDLLEGCKKLSLHVVAVAGGGVFGPKGSQIGSTGSPEDIKLFLIDTAVLKPVKLHVRGFGALWLDVTTDNFLSVEMSVWIRGDDISVLKG